MKKFLFLLIPFFSGCACIFSQPPQTIFAGSGCTASLPDYKTCVTVSGGCTGFLLTQSPAPGTLLTVTNKIVTVTLKATGSNNKSSQITFTVTMIDTITPKITPIGILAEANLKQINDLFDVGDKLVKNMFDTFDARFPYDSLGYNRPVDSLYYKKFMVIVSNDSLNYRQRFITFADSLNIY